MKKIKVNPGQNDQPIIGILGEVVDEEFYEEGDSEYDPQDPLKPKKKLPKKPVEKTKSELLFEAKEEARIET